MKLGKQLKYEHNSTTYGVNVYTDVAEVGAPYLSLRIESTLCYVQLGKIGEVGNSHIRVEKSGKTLALQSSSQDASMIADGGSVSDLSASALPAGVQSASYSGMGQNVTVAYTAQVTPAMLKDSDVITHVKLTWTKHISLAAADHFKIMYGDTTACINVAGTTAYTNTSYEFDYAACPNSIYVKIIAEDASNNKLYESAVYASKISKNRISLITQKIQSSDSTGTTKTLVYSGVPVTRSISWDIGSALTSRYYYVASTSTTGVDTTATIACADTCTCNCNYCTCNCNYCTCNCNYCTCNCDYNPCACSSSP